MDRVEVYLPFYDQPISLSIGDRIVIPSYFWEIAIESVNKVEKEGVLLPATEPITGVVRWLGVLPSIGGQKKFAGIETVSKLQVYICLVNMIQNNVQCMYQARSSSAYVGKVRIVH